MNRSTLSMVCSILLLAGSPPAHAVSGDDGPGDGGSSYSVLAPGSTVAGRSIAAWSALWWTWAWNSPAAADPLKDSTGAFANRNNDAAVYFVGGASSTGNYDRSFTVPAGKPLLVPMINFWESCPGDPAASCGPTYLPNPAAVLKTDAAIYKASVTDVFVKIDGVAIADPFSHWEVSDTFSGGVAKSGTSIVAFASQFGLDIVGEEISPSQASGYYAMVAGLSQGVHTLQFGGSSSGSQLAAPITYTVTAHIDVQAVPEPASRALMVAGLALLGWKARRRRAVIGPPGGGTHC